MDHATWIDKLTGHLLLNLYTPPVKQRSTLTFGGDNSLTPGFNSRNTWSSKNQKCLPYRSSILNITSHLAFVNRVNPKSTGLSSVSHPNSLHKSKQPKMLIQVSIHRGKQSDDHLVASVFFGQMRIGSKKRRLPVIPDYGTPGAKISEWWSLPSGELTFCYGKIHHAINGKIHYFYGHFPLLC